MLNQAAQKFIFMLEKITMGLGWARALCAPLLWILPVLERKRRFSVDIRSFNQLNSQT